MRVGRSAAVMCVLAATAMAGQSGPILPVPIIDQDEAALSDLSYFSAAVIGELTGDGVADLLVTRRGPGGVGSGQLSVYQGDGAGGLVQVSRLAIGGDPTSVLLEDLTGDGRVDALITDGAASTLSIYAQRDAGRFELVETITTGRTPVEAALADVTGDGIADLLVCNYDHYFVGLHEGLAGGGFVPVVRLNVGLRPTDMEVIDFDGDGDLDVLTADELSGTVSLLENEAGVLAPAVVAIELAGVSRMAAADLDGDGVAELIVASRSDGRSSLRVYRNSGGVFTLERVLDSRLGDQASYVLLDDVDRDGNADLIVAWISGVEMYWGEPSGFAETANPVLFGGRFVARWGGVVAGDLTHAGGASTSHDLVFVEPARVSVAFAARDVPAGTAGLWVPVAIDHDRARTQVAGQFTDDAIPDVLITDELGSRLLAGMGGGAFAEPIDMRALEAQDLIAARLRLGELDDVLLLGGSLRLIRPDGSGGFDGPFGLSDLGRSVALGDLDGDGDIDIAVGGPNTAEFLFNDGHGDFTRGDVLDFPGALGKVEIGDVTGDGQPDILVTTGIPSIHVWPGLGDGVFGARAMIDTGLRNNSLVWAIDVGDTAHAVLIQGGSGTLQLVRHLGTPSQTSTVLLDTFERIEGVQVLDVDGDDREDIAVFRGRRFGTTIWLQGHDGVFEPKAAFAWWASVVRLIEATGDGEIDALLGFGNRTWLAIGKPGSLVACAADLDGDGRLTLLDFLEFQTLFAAGDPAADFDGDGELTVFDFLRYQSLFDIGCP